MLEIIDVQSGVLLTRVNNSLFENGRGVYRMLVVKIIVGVIVAAFIWLLTSTQSLLYQGNVKVVESFGKH